MGFNIKDYETIVLGALLHDIGKLVQRASEKPTQKKHTEWGYEWMKKNFPENPANLATIAHHRTKEGDFALTTNMGLIWYQADNLASRERKDKELLQEGEWHSEIAMASPFSRINNPLSPNEKPPLTYLPLKPKGIPFAVNEEPKYSFHDYKEVLSSLENDLLSQPPPLRSSINFLLMLLEKHLKTVPSITLKVYDGLTREEIKDKHPDVSLFDHLKLTAAIAGCMYHYYSKIFPTQWDQNEFLDKEILNVPQEKQPYLLIGGDISGIQRFIYTITSKGALKSLKGRSFYVELLVEHVVSKLLEDLMLSRCNIIFMGGGVFYILSYNTPDVWKVIENVKESINEFLFEQFKGSLFLNIETVAFHPEAFHHSQDLWPTISKKLEESKKKKWFNKLSDILKVSMPHSDSLTRYCEVCFREDTSLEPVFVGKEEIYSHVCAPCANQYELGQALKSISQSSKGVIYCFDESEFPKDRYKSIAICGTHYVVTEEIGKLNAIAKKIYRLNDLNASNYNHSQAIYFPVGNFQHKNLVELSDASDVYGINRLAVLRMDVDNLGKIFSQAVPLEHRTFSRMASISRALNDFFKYHINSIVKEVRNHLVKRNGNIQRMLSIVYAGGDDLFLVGHWLDVMEAAIDINHYFVRYTGNPFVTISGGISINHSKYPIYLYAREADDAEKEAKSFKEDNEEMSKKNSITFFKGKPLRWYQVERLTERVSLFEQFLVHGKDSLSVDAKRLPKTFFYRLLALARMFNEHGMLVLPKAAYLLSRARFGSTERDIKMAFSNAVMQTKKEEWKITELATLIILMLMRKGGKDDER